MDNDGIAITFRRILRANKQCSFIDQIHTGAVCCGIVGQAVAGDLGAIAQGQLGLVIDAAALVSGGIVEHLRIVNDQMVVIAFNILVNATAVFFCGIPTDFRIGKDHVPDIGINTTAANLIIPCAIGSIISDDRA